jgi:hypothetical protein
MVHDQHSENAEHRDCNRKFQRRGAGSAQTIFLQNLRHLKIRVDFLTRLNPGDEECSSSVQQG